MGIKNSRTALMLSVALLSGASIAGAAGPRKSPAAGGTRSAVIAVVNQFEQAYAHKDKKTMIMKLMVPTEDAGALEKRYQWLRGYGPKDMPGSVHPPILFESSKGSFLPTHFAVTAASPTDSNHWNVTVREEGTYHDEDGKYRVNRVRRFTTTKFKGKWYVGDYVLMENTEDYGFFVDDIADKMTPLGKK